MRRRAGCIWIAAGAVLALLAGALAFWAIFRAASQPIAGQPREPTVDVVVASRALGVRELIAADAVELRQAPASVVPETALRRVEDALGRITLVPLASGEMILSGHVISPTVKGEYYAFTMDAGKVAMAFPATDLMSRNNLLQPGDHVDLLFSIEVEEQEAQTGALVTFSALQNLEIAAIVQPKAGAAQAGQEAGRPLAIILTLDPQDALVLKHLQDRGGWVDIVLRAPGVEERFETKPVQLDYIFDRYTIRIPVGP